MKAKEEKNESERKERDIKIALVGSPNVGKSTLFNKLSGGRRSIVEDKPGITRDRLYAKLNIKRFLKDSTYIENGDSSDFSGKSRIIKTYIAAFNEKNKRR